MAKVTKGLAALTGLLLATALMAGCTQQQAAVDPRSEEEIIMDETNLALLKEQLDSVDINDDKRDRILRAVHGALKEDWYVSLIVEVTISEDNGRSVFPSAVDKRQYRLTITDNEGKTYETFISADGHVYIVVRISIDPETGQRIAEMPPDTIYD